MKVVVDGLEIAQIETEQPEVSIGTTGEVKGTIVSEQPGVITLEAEPESVFPPFDSSTFGSQILWLAITFGLLYYLMSKMALPRIAGILESRRDRIAGDLAEAERLKQDTDKAIAAYEGALAEARQKAHELANSTRDSLTAETTARRTKVEKELSAKLEKAETRIADIKTAALAEVDTIAKEATIAVVESVAGISVTEKDASKAVSDSMKV
jgi:F-type H+-transporting ATPase subunit b